MEYLFVDFVREIEKNCVLLKLYCMDKSNKDLVSITKGPDHELYLKIGYNALQCTICLIVLFSFEEIHIHMEQIHSEFQSLYCAKSNCKQIVNGVKDVTAHRNERQKRGVLEKNIETCN